MTHRRRMPMRHARDSRCGIAAYRLARENSNVSASLNRIRIGSP